METLNTFNFIRQAQHPESVLVDEYGSSLYRFCRSLTYSKEDAEDLFQETFLRALEQPEKLNTSDNPKSLLFSTAFFLWKSWKRKYARRKRLAPLEPFDDSVESDINLENSYLIQEENKLVRKLADALPDKFRIPVFLYYTMEMKVSDIADVLNLPAGTVKSRLSKARRLIRDGLEEMDYEK
ncbi:MAG: RNA polymerase sigma factor [Lachnospiraceae bacterium]